MSVPYFPQLSTGALSQYPVQKRISYRTIANHLEDGSRVVLADPNAGVTRWQMSYAGLSDTESDTVLTFFTVVEGRLRPFTFLDPVGNLLGWSERLAASAWQINALAGMQPAATDPLGTQRATTIGNNGAAALGFGQTIAVPGAVTCCWSIYARSNSAQVFSLNRTSGGVNASRSFTASAEWRRVELTSSLPAAGDTSLFQVMLEAGASLDLFGLQVDAQPAASQYVPTVATGGVYAATRFDMDELSITATGPDQNSCVVQFITHVNG